MRPPLPYRSYSQRPQLRAAWLFDTWPNQLVRVTQAAEHTLIIDTSNLMPVFNMYDTRNR
ncbi:MAG: hypothetical protein EXS31_02290 [Pedosphaera sp.]|nr:hypothetical protein [Pedosphaera sp.]